MVVNNAVLLALHHSAGLHYLVPSSIAVQIAVVHNYALNELWTFSHRRESVDSGWVARFGKVQAISHVGMAINLGILALLKGLAGLPLLPSNLVGIAAAAVYNYSTSPTKCGPGDSRLSRRPWRLPYDHGLLATRRSRHDTALKIGLSTATRSSADSTGTSDRMSAGPAERRRQVVPR